MGGFMRPRGHLQVVVNAVDYGHNPQECLDAPRFQWTGERKIELEMSSNAELVRALRAMGHDVSIQPDSVAFGRGQIIWRMESGVLCGGTEPRCDGQVAVW